MKELVEKLEKIRVGKEVINISQEGDIVVTVEVVKNYGDVEIVLYFEIDKEDGAGYTAVTLVNGVSVGSGPLADTFNLKDHTKTMNAGICAIQSKNAIKWTNKVYPIIDEQIDDLVFSELEEPELIVQENEDFQAELEAEELESEELIADLNDFPSVSEKDSEEDSELDEEEYDALEDLLDF